MAVMLYVLYVCTTVCVPCVLYVVRTLILYVRTTYMSYMYSMTLLLLVKYCYCTGGKTVVLLRMKHY